MKKFEYKFVLFHGQGLVKELNAAGDEGWEIVGYAPDNNQGGSWTQFLMKREKE